MSHIHSTVIGKGWARTAVNATVFRRNSVVSDSNFQYVAYYDAERQVILAQRQLGFDGWTIAVTPYTGNTSDAHNVISIMVDGAGYLHMTWSMRQDNLISGEDERNAYWQTAIDEQGTIHLSWVWRETPDVATNHDMCYAKSDDNGVTWRKSTGEDYTLPITQSSAEYACRIPQNSFLMNQTAMCADSQGRPYIATYWRPTGSDIPQYHIIYHDGDSWQTQQVTQRKTPFDVSGTGSRRVPFARPQIVVDVRGEHDKAYIIYRDVERGDKVSVAICDDLQAREWRIEDLTDSSVTVWEPSYDTEFWKREHILHLYVQNTEQGDGEKEVDFPPQDVTILEWKP